MQALPAPSESLCIVEMGGTEATETGERGMAGGLFLNIGLHVSSHAPLSVYTILSSLEKFARVKQLGLIHKGPAHNGRVLCEEYIQ